MAMQVTLSPELEAIVEERLATGAYADVEDLLRRALEAVVEEDTLTPDELAHIEEGYQQSLRGEFTEGEQAFREIAEANRQWLREHKRK